VDRSALLTPGEGMTTVPLPLVIRRNDFTLDDDEQAVADSFASFFADYPLTKVREHEPLGFDPDLWAHLCSLGGVSMPVPSAAGGDGGSLVQAALIAELCGDRVAPVPFAEAVAVARLLARLEEPDPALLANVLAGQTIIGLASRSAVRGWPQLVGCGAVADAVIGLSGGSLVLLTPNGDKPKHVLTQGSLPTAYWSPEQCEVRPLADPAVGPRLFEQACAEYKVLTASALAGLAATAIALAAGFATTRMTRGVPIGSLQGISHPLVDAKIRTEGVRQTARKAAWFCEHEPEADPKLPSVAFIGAARAAEEATRVSVHTHGGMGVMVEGDASLYFLRAISWASVVGGVADELAALARILQTPRYLDVVYPSML
jgi:alkylation response protein AidB-like acyl-CoA dehydrogenase